MWCRCLKLIFLKSYSDSEWWGRSHCVPLCASIPLSSVDVRRLGTSQLILLGQIQSRWLWRSHLGSFGGHLDQYTEGLTLFTAPYSRCLGTLYKQTNGTLGFSLFQWTDGRTILDISLISLQAPQSCFKWTANLWLDNTIRVPLSRQRHLRDSLSLRTANSCRGIRHILYPHTGISVSAEEDHSIAASSCFGKL